MLNDYTRGGQLFLHKIRMLRQVWDKTLFGSFIVSSIVMLVFSYKELVGLDYPAGITYVKAHISEEVNGIFGKKTTRPKITSLVKDGIYAKDISAKVVINHPGFKRKFSNIVEVYLNVGLHILYLTIGILFFVIIIWSRVGSRAIRKDIIRGDKVLSDVEVAKILKKLGKASNFVVADMPLVKDKETSHILITGTTGSGKSNCMHYLLPQIRKKDQQAVIVDFTGEMVDRYYDSSKGDIIINPYEQKAHSWDFWSEVKNPHNLSSISNSLFATKGSNYDEMWNNVSKQFFEDATNIVLKSANPTIKELYKILAIDSLKEVSNKLKSTASSSVLDPKNERTAMSVRTNTIAFIEWMKDYNETEPSISLSYWFNAIKNEDEHEKGKWLFLTSSPSQRNRLQSFHSMLFDLILSHVMELGADPNRRLWFIIDELPALKRLPSLPTALSEFRKYGGCIMAGVQSVNQLYKIYGQYEGLTMLDQFNTKFIFRTEENNFANYICKNFGDIEYTESTENYSYGAHEMRDGVSSSKVEKKKSLVNPSDLAALKDCEAYVKLPESSVRIAKIQIKYHQ